MAAARARSVLTNIRSRQPAAFGNWESIATATGRVAFPRLRGMQPPAWCFEPPSRLGVVKRKARRDCSHSGGVALLNHRLRAGTPAGVRSCGVWFPVVSRCSTTGYGPSSLRDDEAGVGGEAASWMRRNVKSGRKGRSGSRAVVWRERGAMGGGWGVGSGIPVVSRCSTTGYGLTPLPGCDFILCGIRWCRSRTRSTTGYGPSSLRDEHAGRFSFLSGGGVALDALEGAVGDGVMKRSK